MSRRSPIGRLIDDLENETGRSFHTISEVAALTGVPVSTIRSYYRNGRTQAPSEYVEFGKLRVYLFSDADVDELHAIKPTAPIIRKRTA